MASKKRVAALVLAGGLGLPVRADATPAQAATLGGLDLYYPGELDTFMYFESDLNLFANPALVARYRNQVQANLGFSGFGLEEGVGVNPRALGLFGIGDSVTLGLALNRSPGEYGENAALGTVLDALTVGSSTPGEIGGGTYQDPLALAGLGVGGAAPALQPPLDLFGAVAFGDSAIGLNLYGAVGSNGTDVKSEVTPGGAENDWTKATTNAMSTWLGATVGYTYDGESVAVEGWLRFTSVSSWSDAVAYGPAEFGGWDDQTDLLVDRTVGLGGTDRVGGGARATIAATDKVDVVPAILVDGAGGHTFAVDRLANSANDPDESAVAQAEDDTFVAHALSLRGGVGVDFHPSDELRIVSAVAVDVQHLGVQFDNHAAQLGVLGSTHLATRDRATTLRLPLVSLGGEYGFSKAFAIRGAVRATTLLNRVTTSSLDQQGIEANNWELRQTSNSHAAFDAGDVPVVTAAIGPSVRLGAATLDGAIGGLLTGAGDDLFSRIDAEFTW